MYRVKFSNDSCENEYFFYHWVFLVCIYSGYWIYIECYMWWIWPDDWNFIQIVQTNHLYVFLFSYFVATCRLYFMEPSWSYNSFSNRIYCVVNICLVVKLFYEREKNTLKILVKQIVSSIFVSQMFTFNLFTW